MYPENPKGTQVIVGSMNMGYDIIYISNTAKNQTHNLFRPKCGPIPLGHIVTDKINSHVMSGMSVYNHNKVDIKWHPKNSF